jgi:hypothetical protein
MTRSTCIRPCALLLVLTLLAPPVFAAPPGTKEGRSSVLSLLWQTLGQLLPIVSDLGPGMDPAGEPDQETTDLGPEMDPAGSPHD